VIPTQIEEICSKRSKVGNSELKRKSIGIAKEGPIEPSSTNHFLSDLVSLPNPTSTTKVTTLEEKSMTKVSSMQSTLVPTESL